MTVPLAYTVEEARTASGIGRTTLYEAAKAGRLRMTKVGGRTLILREDLQRFLGDCRASDEELAELLELVDEDGRVTVDAIPRDCMVSLAELKRAVAERRQSA